MKVNSRFVPALFASSAFARLSFFNDNHCLSDDDANALIQDYTTTFQGIPPGGSLESVEELAKKTFADDVKMYSQSLLWVQGYQGPFDIYPPFVKGMVNFTREYNHTYAPYTILASSYGCGHISVVWAGNFSALFGLNPKFGLTAGVDLAFVKPGTKKIGTIFSETNSLQAALAAGGHITGNPDLTACPPP